MKVTVSNSPRNDQPYVDLEGLPCFFEHGSPIPEVGAEVEVMISRVLHPRQADGYLNREKVSCVLLRADLSEWTKVSFEGFETSGSMCTTSSRAVVLETGERIYATPGRVGVYEADNVNVRWQKGTFKRQPGIGWVDLRPMKNGRVSNSPRLIGVESLASLEAFSRHVFVPYSLLPQKVTRARDELNSGAISHYYTDHSFQIRREFGIVPMDTANFNGAWVLRTAANHYVAHDEDLQSLARRYAIQLETEVETTKE